MKGKRKRKKGREMRKRKRKKKAKWKRSEGKKEMLIELVKKKSRLTEEYRFDLVTSGLSTNLECSF